MNNKSSINNNKDEEYGMSSDILAKVLENINEKLDRLIDKVNSMENRTNDESKTVRSELEKHDIRIKSLESEKDKPLKNKILDQAVTGFAYCFGAFVLFLGVIVIVKSFGGSATGILKALFSTLGA